MGSVNYLLDTHTLLWAALEEEKLSGSALKIIEDINAPLFVSAVSAYEIMFKHKIGKLDDYTYVVENYFDILDRLGVKELPISAKHAHLAGKMDWEHRDPFDRFLAAQASVENMTLISSDPEFKGLPWLSRLW